MDDMKRRLLLLLSLVLGCVFSVYAQGASQDLFLRTNNLRGGLGLHTYRWNAQLAAAAQSHANWLANTSRDCRLTDCHRDDAGRFARDRARIAGYPGERVHENYYRGGDPSADSAWSFWLNSSVHYQNLTSANNSEIGIAVASAGGRYAFVQVFGHRGGAAAASGQAGSSDGAAPDAAGPPAYVLGLDEFGNIKHEVQPGHTIGDIALFYGYTWDDIPAMLELNGMTWDDIRALQPGNVFLVPPQDGTFTPTSPPPAATATATAPAVPARATPSAMALAPTASPTYGAARALRIEIAPTRAALTASAEAEGSDRLVESAGLLMILGAAILAQLGILGGAILAFLRRPR